MRKLESRGEKSFRVAALIILFILAACAFLPFLLIIISSLTDEKALVSNGYSFFPAKWEP